MAFITAVAEPRLGTIDSKDKAVYAAKEVIGQTVNHITYPGTVWINDVRSMITNVLAKAEKKKITRLNIIDHGNPTGCYIGTDWITVNNFENFSPFLGKLYPAFEKDGFVHLQHCQMGQNKNLMRMFAQIFGVAVYAGTGNEHAGVPYNEGWYVRCSPGGQIYNNTLPPGESFTSKK
jgi:hypothetical protein